MSEIEIGRKSYLCEYSNFDKSEMSEIFIEDEVEDTTENHVIVLTTIRVFTFIFIRNDKIRSSFTGLNHRE